MTLIPEIGINVPSTWNVETLERVTSKIGSGATPRGGSSVYVESGPALIRSQNIYDHQFKTDGLVFLSSEAASALRGVTVEKNDVLINITGDSILRVTTVPETILPARVNQHVAIVRSNGKVDPGYLQKWLSLPLMKDFMLGHSAGGTRKAVTKGHLQSFPIPVPPIPEQRAIAATLGALDDKIESNRRLIELIPRLVRARADMALTNESVVVPVSDLASFTNGGAYTKGSTGTGRMVIRIAELNSGPGGSTVYNDIQVPEVKTARAGDLLMAWSGSLGVYRWYRDESIINQHIFKVVPDEYPAWLAFDRLEAVMPVFRALAADKATTMGHIQRGHLTSTTVSVPTGAAIAQLDEELAPLWERLLLAERENLQLSRLRETLLPELFSGRLRVPAEVS